jgi:hypothetical protein
MHGLRYAKLLGFSSSSKLNGNGGIWVRLNYSTLWRVELLILRRILLLLKELLKLSFRTENICRPESGGFPESVDCSL